MPAMRAETYESATTSSSQGTGTAVTRKPADPTYVRVFVTGGSVRIAQGPSATVAVTATTGMLIPDGGEVFLSLADGEAVAYIDSTLG